MSRGRPALAVTTLLVAYAIASCAPHRVTGPRLEPARVADRYRAACRARAALAGGLDAEASAWLKGESLRDLPGVHARLALGAPDAFRVRVESLFGVALDFAAWGDSLACYMPPRRQGVALDAAVDTLGICAPGPLGVHVLAATWEPPDSAWARADFEDTLLVVRWVEARDSLALGVGSDGLPRWAMRVDAKGRVVEARYRAWRFVESASWPERMEFEHRPSGATLTLKLANFARSTGSAPERLVVRIPAGAERLEWSAVRRALGRNRGL